MSNALLEGNGGGVACGRSGYCGQSFIGSAGSNWLSIFRPEVLRKSLIQLSSNQSLRSRLGREGRQLMINRYSFDKIAAEYFSLYLELHNDI